MKSIDQRGTSPRIRGMATVVMASLVVSIVTNLFLAAVLLQHKSAPEPAGQGSANPRCTAIPVKLILEDPECADKLLRAMNVTNVRVGRADRSEDSGADYTLPIRER